RDAHLHFGLLTDFPMRPRRPSQGTISCFNWPQLGSTDLIENTCAAGTCRQQRLAALTATQGLIRRLPVCSISFIVLDAGMRRHASGWAMSASAASSPI